MTATNFYNYEAETQVIGSVLTDPDLMNDLIIEADHFYEPKHQKLFKWFKSIHSAGVPIDLVSIVEIAKDRINEVGGVSYLSEIMGSIPTTENIKFYEDLVIEHWRSRARYLVYKEAMTNSADDTIESKTKQALEEIEKTGKRHTKFSIRDQLVKNYDKMESMKGGLAGSPTGFTDLDTMLEGVEKKKLIIVAARPSVGKTAFALNIGQGLIKASITPESIKNNRQEVFTSIFSLEMGADQLTNRMISSVGNIDGMKVKNPIENFNSDDWSKYTMAAGEISNWEDNIDICDESTIKVEGIRSRVRENQKAHPDKHHVIIIDYLQLIKPSAAKGSREQEISEISRSLKVMANELDCTIIALSQLSRGVEQRQDKRPMLSDIRESGSIEQDADIVAFLYRDDYYDKESDNKNIIEIIIAKNREGSVGTVQLAYIKEYSKFVNLERRFDQAS
jgi:replicative DNA helicase